MDDLKDRTKEYARELGFDLVGVCSAERFSDHEAVTLERLRRGLMDGLPWYTESRVRRGCHPEDLLPGARSILTVGLSYNLPDDAGEEVPGPSGKVARYSWGDDYHVVMKERLRTLAEGLPERLGRPLRARWYVDDGPMLDRAVAQRGGIGWFGKNTNLLTPSHGSWVFLGQLITDLPLEPDPPLKKTCGSCVRCIDACPTGAIVAPYVIDNARCIAYLTIENRGPIPRQLRPLMRDWVFGCDICQDVCPVNVKAAYTREQAFQKRRFSSVDLVGLLRMTEEQFRERFRNSPAKRARLAGLRRNACVALGNAGDPAALPALAEALEDAEPLVRSHAAWALGRLGGLEASRSLESALGREGDPAVLEEIQAALMATAGATADPGAQPIAGEAPGVRASAR
jgi:epoxyqueuosine reductase